MAKVSFAGIDRTDPLYYTEAPWQSLSLRSFLRPAPPAAPPDHSTISRTRRLLWSRCSRRPARLHEIAHVKLIGRVQDYHSNDALVDLKALGLRSYLSEPDRGRRCWKGQPSAGDAGYARSELTQVTARATPARTFDPVAVRIAVRPAVRVSPRGRGATGDQSPSGGRSTPVPSSGARRSSRIVVSVALPPPDDHRLRG